MILGWSRIVSGYHPLLSIEITKECPLKCPGCYAYGHTHVDGGRMLGQLADYRGDSLVHGLLDLVRRHRPIHISIVGGEPLVRYRELDTLLPRLEKMSIEVQLVTSAVRPIPAHWAGFKCLHVAVSVDGLPEEHDRRRAPATYDRILKNIQGHVVIVHCTVTRQMLARPGYLHDFAAFWSNRREARKIWFSLFTPQEGDVSEERLAPGDRAVVARELLSVAARFPKVNMPKPILEAYMRPPASPEECLFAKLTACVSADLATPVTPCQIGGRPICSECGCMAAAGLGSIGRYKIAGLMQVSHIIALSRRLGERFGQVSSTFAAP